MKSHIRAGQFKLRGKKELLLSCGCCVVKDLREAYLKRIDRLEIVDAMIDACIYDLEQVEICAVCHTSSNDLCDFCQEMGYR